MDVPDLPWSDLGEGAEAGFRESASFPGNAEILAEWRKLSEPLAGALAGAGPELLAQPSPLPIPGIEAPTLIDFAKLNVVHEGYHVGQLGLALKTATGHGPLEGLMG